MKAPAGGRLPHRGRWQGEALTDEGGTSTGKERTLMNGRRLPLA